MYDVLFFRRRVLDEIKQCKLAELRAAGVPEKYCAEISQKITAPHIVYNFIGCRQTQEEFKAV